MNIAFLPARPLYFHLVRPATLAPFALFTALLALAAPVAAQTGPPQRRAQNAPSTKVNLWLSVTGEYDDNIFQLSPSRKDVVNDPSSADAASGRFDRMEQAEDLIAHAAGGASVEMRGMGGRDFTVLPILEYNYYTRNTERSYFTAALALQQELPRSSRLQFSATHTPDYFAKNYLVNAVDENSDGSISLAERRYAAGRYSETDLDLGYRFRLRRGTRTSPLAARMEVGAGYYSRSYDAPFESRDLSGPTFGAELDVEPTRSVGFALAYKLGLLSADPAREVLILDEPSVGRDLNGNGRSTDLAVRTEQTVDRSRTEHEATVATRLDLTRNTSLRVIYGMRLRNYSSDEPFDLAHRDRRDTRNEIRGELVTKLARSIRLTTGGRYARQTTNRSFDPDQSGDAEDYSRLRAYVGLRYEFR